LDFDSPIKINVFEEEDFFSLGKTENKNSEVFINVEERKSECPVNMSLNSLTISLEENL